MARKVIAPQFDLPFVAEPFRLTGGTAEDGDRILADRKRQADETAASESRQRPLFGKQLYVKSRKSRSDSRDTQPTA